jgi:yersiniabactin nonribosomal peptide synthetase
MEYAKVKKQIKEMLADMDVDDSQNLLELGLNSLQIMRLVNQWRKQGVRVSFGEIMERPNLARWWQLLQAAGKKTKPEKKQIVPEKPAKANQPFPLTDVQYAYWIGREDGQALGGVGCHAYLEFDGKNVEAEKLEKAWNILQSHHPMLRARFLRDGRQEIREKPYSEKIAVYDLRKDKNAAKQLGEIRESCCLAPGRIVGGGTPGRISGRPPGNLRLYHHDLRLDRIAEGRRDRPRQRLEHHCRYQ